LNIFEKIVFLLTIGKPIFFWYETFSLFKCLYHHKFNKNAVIKINKKPLAKNL